MSTIDLNADLGEGMPWDFELLGLVTSANVSCGAHAGDRDAISATLAEAGRLGLAVGAHPSWPDREGFGRRDREATAEEVRELVIGQVEWLRFLATGVGVYVRYLKPHGALYNQAMRDGPGSEPIRVGILEASRTLALPLLGQPGTILERMASEIGILYVAEGFPDRAYREDGRLVPRSEPGACLEGLEEVVVQAVKLAGRGIGSLCLHGDSAGAVARAVAIRRALEAGGYSVTAFAG